jgi:enamine deaminase RidA (YjgF/YER057c/UK114 family)
MTTPTPEQKLAAVGLTLPAVPTPVANYVPYRWAGNLLFLSGQGPKQPDGTFEIGRLGKDATVGDGYRAARLTVLQLLAVAKSAIGELSRIEAVVKLLGMVNAEPTSPITPKSSTVARTCLLTRLARRVATLARPSARVRSPTHDGRNRSNLAGPALSHAAQIRAASSQRQRRDS